MVATADLSTQIMACLQRDDPEKALIELSEQPFDFDIITDYKTPPRIIGIAAAAMLTAHLRKGEAGQVTALLERFSDSLAPAHRRGEGNWRMLGPFHFLFAPLIEAALARTEYENALQLLVHCAKEQRRRKDDDDPEHGELVAALATKGLGLFSIEPPWLLERLERALSAMALDHRLLVVQRAHARLLEMALLANQPERALPLIEQELEWYLCAPVLDASHFEFNAFCVLARLNRYEQALEVAKRLVRRGYHQSWRFNISPQVEPSWELDKLQHQWLIALVQTAPYQQFLKDYLPDGRLGDEAELNPLCLVKDDVFHGKTNKRCAISRAVIQPGDAVVRFRKLFNRASDGKLEMASKAAFEASTWQTNRQQLQSEQIPLGSLFPRQWTIDAKLNDAPLIHEFCFDLAHAPERLDITKAVQLIAEHAPAPVPYSWQKPNGLDRWRPAAPIMAGADGHGDAVNLTWRLIKTGYREQIIDEVSKLPQERAGKVFAMLATFADDRLRMAAADFFNAPSLPQIMATVFKDRLSFDDHQVLADFGHRTPRWRAGLVSAMNAYGLHLYSNYQPTVDWFLAGLEHFAMAGGSALLYFLIDHPEDDPVLQTIIETRWLPERANNSDELANATPFYVRATLFHLYRHKPQELAAWLDPIFVAQWKTMAYDRETLRLSKTMTRQAARR